MNTKKIFASVIALTALLSAYGCSEKEVAENTEPVSINTNIDPHSIVFDWQSLYKSKIEEYMSADGFSKNDARFDLYDINRDGTPELILSPNTDTASKCEIYTYDSGLEKFDEIGTFGMFKHIPELNCIGYEYIGEGFMYGEFSSMDNVSGEPVITYYNNVASAASGAVIRYEVNGKEMSLIEYENAISPYSASAAVVVGRKYTFGEKSIDYALNCSESWGAVLSDAQKVIYKNILTDIIAVSPENDAAFDIADLDGNNIPELIVSTGITDESDCRVYYLNEAVVSDLGTGCGRKGCFSFDFEKNILFSENGSDTLCWSLVENDLGNFKKSESCMECGRTYLLTVDSVNYAFR